MIRKLVYLFLLIAINSCAKKNEQKNKQRPNIILFFTDDQGYADIGCFGANGFETPNLDQMAEEGTMFTDFYVSAPTSTPSRMSLLTGCYPSRNFNSIDKPENARKTGLLIHEIDTSVYNGIQKKRIRDIMKKEPGAIFFDVWSGINSNETTIAELLKQKGYTTAMYGKWDVGRVPKFYPSKHGFDEYMELPNSHDFSPYITYPPILEDNLFFPHLPLIENDSIIEYDPNPDFLTKRCTDKAVDFINRNHESPFFIYMAYSMPHVPLGASPEFKGKTENGLYGDVIHEIDFSVGQILKTIEEQGLTENTLVIFTSDNGPWLVYGTHAGNAEPLREGKKTYFEGGIRVPCIMKWPGVIPQNQVCSQPAMTIDLLPTFADITGARLPELPIDGKSILPLMKNPEKKSSETPYFFYKGGDNSPKWDNSKIVAVRIGKWKLILPHEYNTLNGREGGKKGLAGEYETASIDTALYNLETDIAEQNNLKDDYPEIVQQLCKLAEDYNKDLKQNRRSASWVTNDTEN